jgi:hypothetical protein
LETSSSEGGKFEYPPVTPLRGSPAVIQISPRWGIQKKKILRSTQNSEEP